MHDISEIDIWFQVSESIHKWQRNASLQVLRSDQKEDIKPHQGAMFPTTKQGEHVTFMISGTEFRLHT